MKIIPFSDYKIIPSWFKSLSWTKIHRILRLPRLSIIPAIP